MDATMIEAIREDLARARDNWNSVTFIRNDNVEELLADSARCAELKAGKRLWGKVEEQLLVLVNEGDVLRQRCAELEAALLHFTNFTSAEMAIEFYNHNVAIAREASDGRED